EGVEVELETARRQACGDGFGVLAELGDVEHGQGRRASAAAKDEGQRGGEVIKPAPTRPCPCAALLPSCPLRALPSTPPCPQRAAGGWTIVATTRSEGVAAVCRFSSQAITKRSPAATATG